MNYDVIINTLSAVLDMNKDTEYSEEERIAYTEGALSFLTNYIISCKNSPQIKIIGGCFDER